MKHSILIVDDDPGLRKTLSDILEVKGYTSADAGTGKAALDQVKKHGFAVAVIDLRLPDMGGLEVVGEIKRCSPGTECIVLTGFASQASAIEAVNVGAYSYVQKPYDVDQLLLTIRRAIEKREAEEETRQLQEFNESILQNVAEGIVVEGADGKITFANPAAASLLGYSPDELLGQPWTILINPDQHDDAQAARERRQRGETDSYEIELLSRKKRRIPVLVSGSPRFVDGQLDGILHVYTDITEQKQAEEALRSERDFAESLIETAPVIVLVLDNEGRIVRFNSYLQEISGYSLEEVRDRTWFETFLPERERVTVRQLFQQAVDDVPNVGNISSLVTKDGREREIEWYDKTLKDAQGSVIGLLAIGRDVTEEREIRRRAAQQERLAAVGQLAAGIAHDFNNIIATIILYGQLLSQSPALSSKDHERLAVISQQAKQATGLIEQILDFSRRSMLERRPLDLLPLMKELTKLLGRTLSDNVQVELTHEPDEYTVNADPARIQQAMMNLALNARDAMPMGGVLRVGLERIQVADGRLSLPEMEAGEWVKVTIADTGIGIPPENLPHIYEPFFTTKAPGQGSGLGLSQVYGIVKQHEGHIGVESRVEAGTTFTLYLPALQVPQTEPAVIEGPPPAHGDGEVILLVEDDPAARAALLDTLEMLNYEVVAAADGQEAMEIYQREADRLSLVMSDLIMPRMGGRELVRRLRTFDPQLKALAITGYALADDIRELKNDGIQEFVQKPFEVAVLADALRRVLDDH